MTFPYTYIAWLSARLLPARTGLVVAMLPSLSVEYRGRIEVWRPVGVYGGATRPRARIPLATAILPTDSFLTGRFAASSRPSGH